MRQERCFNAIIAAVATVPKVETFRNDSLLTIRIKQRGRNVRIKVWHFNREPYLDVSGAHFSEEFHLIALVVNAITAQ